ncbi:hypothetical protein [Flammeovirga aprica]|uniref:Uncharacterized protein n=1 Tax=Flammeovirga aprica JL-4 TaxID=694437 RepID=A0A7X9XDW2_9BACT|nr:hypothetical protein [Flammeovirga aprica]NME73094.1 hypothetical protein [Flammeovirga aprica JL-4]
MGDVSLYTYIFIEHKVGKKAGDNARMAAEKAYQKIDDIAKKKKVKVFVKNRPLIRIKYLDDQGQLQLFKPNI